MNCTEVRKFLYAFADGQLNVQTNCQVLDHLKMCAGCSRQVDEHQTLRTALRRDLERSQVPRGLEERVRKAVATGRPVRSGGGLRVLFGVRTFAVAACLVLVATVAWRYVIPAGRADPSNGEAVVYVPPGGGAASTVVEVHNLCCEHAASHHAEGLPQDLGKVAPAISVRYNYMIEVLAPDLSDHGFTFESASFCGVRNRKGCAGGHLLYVKQDQTTRLSVFSVPRWDCLDRCGGTLPAAGGVQRYRVGQDGGPDMAVAVWHGNATSYICCGRIGVDEMSDLVEDVRVALSRPQTQRLFAMLQP